MKNLEQQSVAEVIHRVPGIARTLREYHIDPTNRMLLSHAAAAASTSVEEILAVAAMRQRHAAHVEQELLEYEFV